jgi:hypothetical protein
MKKNFLILICLIICFSLSDVSFAQEKPPVADTAKSEEKVAEALAKAKTLLLAARKAKSDIALDQVKDITITSDAQITIQGQTLDVTNKTTIKFPNKVLTVVLGPFGEIKNCYNGEFAWVKTPGGVQELVGDNTIEFQNAIAGDPISILRDFDKPDCRAEFIGETSWEGQTVNSILFTTSIGHEIKLYIDPKTNHIIGKSYESKVGENTFTNEDVFSNFQTFKGVQVPMKRVLKRNGELFAESIVKEVVINSGVEDKIFAKPQ